jgi:hypothetical protein
MIPVMLIIYNSGEKTAEDVELLLEMNRDFYKQELKRKWSEIAVARRMVVAQEKGQGELQQIYYKLNDVSPKREIKVGITFLHRVQR